MEKTIAFRVSSAQYEKFRENAKNQGKTLSNYVRDLVLDSENINIEKNEKQENFSSEEIEQSNELLRIKLVKQDELFKALFRVAMRTQAGVTRLLEENNIDYNLVFDDASAQANKFSHEILKD